MAKYIINGGEPLRGAVRLGGAKNASFKLMIAAAMANSESRLLNLSHIGDVEVTAKTLRILGVKVEECGNRTMFIYPNRFKTSEIPKFTGEKSRGATFFAAILLGKLGKAVIPYPGGCSLGPRPIDRHLEAFKALGAQVEESDNQIVLTAKDGLKAGEFTFSKKTHTGTEVAILAACFAEGETILHNVALEPEVDDLILFINKMGGDIQRQKEDIVIHGGQKLHGTIHRVMPDRNEAVSYAVAALATKGDIVIENARAKDLQAFLDKVEEIGGKFTVADYGIRFWWEKPLQACDVITAAEPGFMTDWQQLWGVLMTQARGTSHIIEAVHNNRLQYTQQLIRMGADIKLYNPEVDDPEKFYDFNIVSGWEEIMHAAAIEGPTPLQATELFVPDLRGGATLVIASLLARGKSVITGIEQIERGYENLHKRMLQLGADIQKV